jgi:hypothetical protein
MTTGAAVVALGIVVAYLRGRDSGRKRQGEDSGRRQTIAGE